MCRGLAQSYGATTDADQEGRHGSTPNGLVSVLAGQNDPDAHKPIYGSEAGGRYPSRNGPLAEGYIGQRTSLVGPNLITL